MHIYGRDNSSREFGDRHRIFGWLLCEAYDPRGNAIVYRYKAENDDGVSTLPSDRHAVEPGFDPTARTRAPYLKTIQYGNRTQSRDLQTWRILPAQEKPTVDWSFSVVFDYGEHDEMCPTSTRTPADWHVRADPFSTGNRGFEVRMLRLCRRILVFHHFPLELGRQDYLVLSTSLQYEETPTRSVLKRLATSDHTFDATQGSYKADTLAPLSFEYVSLPDLGSQKIQSMRLASL